jgi:hypothetical protein
MPMFASLRPHQAVPTPQPQRATAPPRWLLAATLMILGLAWLPAVAPAAPRPAPQGLSDQTRVMQDIKALVDLGPRRTGTPGGDRAAAFVGQGLRDAGIPQVWEEHATTYQWEATSWGMTLDGRTVDAFPATQTFFGEDRTDWTGTFSTGPSGRTAEVVDVGDGGTLGLAGKDLRGKIVLFNLRFEAPMIGLGAVSEWLYDPKTTLFKDPATLGQANPYITNYVKVVRELQQRGAVGFVGVLSDYFDSNHYRNENYRRLNVTLPGFWVTARQGRGLRDQLRTGTRRATVKLEGRRWAATARTVLGFLPGQSTETVMVQSHHDSLGPGAVEDASGTASVLAQARYWAQRPISERPRSLLFITFDSHFTGYQAHMAFGKKYLDDPDAPFRVVANATIEHIAKQGVLRRGTLTMRETPEPRGIFRLGGTEVKRTIIEAVRKYDLQRLALINISAISPEGGIPTDASFVSMEKIPTVSYISGPIYLYDDIDTIDKVDERQLVPVNAAFVDIISRLSSLPKDKLEGR